MSDDKHPWTRRGPSKEFPKGESSTAYDAFKAYMRLGKDRSLSATCTEVGKTITLIKRWSKAYEWVDRAAAYDSYLVSAEVDGEATELSRVRNKHLDVADRLLDHLADSMSMWPQGHDPSIRWTQAFAAAAKVQQMALSLREQETKSDQALIDRVMSVLEKQAEG